MLFSAQIFTVLLAAAPSAMGLDMADDESTALALFSERRFAEAAARFEELWRTLGEPRHLFNAAVAREFLGQDAAAHLHLLRARIAPELTPEELAEVAARLEKLVRRTARLRVIVTPAVSAGLQLLAERIDVDGVELSVDDALLAPVGHPGAIDLQVESGTWRISAAPPGAPPVVADVKVVAPGLIEVRLDVTPAPVQATIEVGPPGALAAGAHVRLIAADGEATLIAGAQASNQLKLVPGTYAVETSAPGFVTASHQVTFSPDARVMAVTLHPSEADEPSRSERSAERDLYGRIRIGVGITSAVAGAGLVAGGVTLTVLGSVANRESDATIKMLGSVDPEVLEAPRQAAAEAQKRTSYGLTLLGSGVGTWIGGVTLGVGGKELALGIEAGLGAGMLAAAVPSLWKAKQCYADTKGSGGETADIRAAEVASIRDCRQKDFLASAALGLGAGMLASSALGLVVRALARRARGPKRMELSLDANPAGGRILLSGRF